MKLVPKWMDGGRDVFGNKILINGRKSKRIIFLSKYIEYMNKQMDG